MLEALATACAGLFAGAALYITLVEQPARLECGTELAATEENAPAPVRYSTLAGPGSRVAHTTIA